MILLVNTFITPIPLVRFERGYMHRDDNLDIFKYTIASLAAVNRWSNVIFHVRLDQPYQHLWEHIRHYIECEFSPVCRRLEIYDWRNEYQTQWKATVQRLDQESDPYVWYSGNHDHLFVDYDHKALDAALAALEADPEERKSVYYSHWPEYNRQQQHRFPHDFRLLPCGTISGRDYTRESIQILSKPLLHSWFVEPDYGDRYIPRSNWFDADTFYTDPYRSIAPFREIGRHYDSYSHLFDISTVPAITVPPGFFERNIKIRYGYRDNRSGWVNINPMRPYKTSTPDGVDYKWVLEDIPLFWRGRIGDIDVGRDYSPDELLAARNRAVRDYITCPSGHPDLGGKMPPEEYVLKSMR